MISRAIPQSVSRLLLSSSRGGTRHTRTSSFRRGTPFAAASNLHAYADRLRLDESRDDDEKLERMRLRALPSVNISHYHSSARPERFAVMIILGLGTLSAAAYSASYAVRAYKEWEASLPVEVEPPLDNDETKTKEGGDESDAQTKEKKKSGEEETTESRENIFATWFGVDVGSNYYEGGFEEKMTRREAALILGVRESSSPRRIKEAHRKLLILNHPDTGGSTFLAGKINEAKELLLKGRREM